MDDESFRAGVVCACDMVAAHDEGTILREIIHECGGQPIIDEIRKNGLDRTKEAMEFELKNSPIRRLYK